MGFAEKRGDYWRGRYKQAPGKYATVQDESGLPFGSAPSGKPNRRRTTRRPRSETRPGATRPPVASPSATTRTVWYAAQDLAASTMQNYRRHIEEHLLPEFEAMAVGDILASDIAAWEKKERAAGYAASSIKTWRATLHLILGDAVDEELRDSNPATRRRGRGKRAGRSRNRGPEKVVTTALGVLLIAERAALLSGRDDEFVAVVLMGFTGMRWGEPVPILAEPWPGIPALGRGAAARAEACRVPIAPGLTPHGLRHTHKTIMEELGIPPKLMDERMGHEDGSVSARYSHVTKPMRQRLLDCLTEQWEAVLAARRAMAPGSPVEVLDRLLRVATT
jgi:site-specific recombinase XerD